MNNSSNFNPKLISLFTGAGGLDIGLEQAGFQTVCANEIEPYACSTLKLNKVLCSLNDTEFHKWFDEQLEQRCYKQLPGIEADKLKNRVQQAVGAYKYLGHANILERDIRTVKSDELLSICGLKTGELDLVAGGPPCQPFSRAGKRENVDCDTGKLFKEFVRIVNDIKPRWFLFENVKGLVITKADVALIVCDNCKTESVAPFEMRESDNNKDEIKSVCPNCSSTKTSLIWRKQRGGSLEIILNEFNSIGYKCHWKILNAADFGAPQSRERLFIVGSRDNEQFTWPEPTHGENKVRPQKPQIAFTFEENTLKPWETMYEALWADGHWKYGKLDTKKAVLWVKNVVRPHDEPVTWSLKRVAPTIGAHQGAKLAVAPYGVPEEQLLRQQWHVLGRRQGDNPPVFVEHEYLTDEELLRIQTFPRSWYLYGTRMQRAFQIGNAVPPVLGLAVGKSVMNAIRASNLETSQKRKAV